MLPVAYPFRELHAAAHGLARARIGRETPGALVCPIQFRRWRMPMLYFQQLSLLLLANAVTP